MVGIDATILTLLLNPDSDSPPDPLTGQPVSEVRARVDFLVLTLSKERQKLCIPSPVLSEVLVQAGPPGLQYVEVLQKQGTVEIGDFGKLAAVELAEMTRSAIASGDKREGSTEPWQKIKIDRQIVAICKVARVRTIYTTDPSLANFARRAGMKVVGLHELPLPPAVPQMEMHRMMEPVPTDEPPPDLVEDDKQD